MLLIMLYAIILDDKLTTITKNIIHYTFALMRITRLMNEAMVDLASIIVSLVLLSILHRSAIIITMSKLFRAATGSDSNKV